MDREKVVKGLEHCTSFDDGREYMKGFVGDPIRAIRELVRCKDCKFHGHDCPYYFAYKRTAPDDWFCADGEMQEGR